MHASSKPIKRNMANFINKKATLATLFTFLTSSGGGYKNVTGISTHILKVIG